MLLKWLSNLSLNPAQAPKNIQFHIQWEASNEGWVEINSDGCVKELSGNALDVVAFCANLGCASLGWLNLIFF